MKKIFLLMSILISAIFTSSCDMDNASIVGTWKTTQFDGVATFDGAEVYQYNLLKDSEINWTFTDLFYVNIDINWAGETHSVNAPFIYKPEHGVLTFLVAKCTDVVLYDNAITCNIEITGDLLSPMQMLMEAVYTEDGSYALKAAPQLIDALGSEGITVVEYSEENRDLFDMFPGTEAGLTIRPAMVKDGKVLARGQATEGIN